MARRRRLLASTTLAFSLAAAAWAAEERTAVDLNAFAREAASGGKMEVELGEFVSRNAVDARVRRFGTHMAADHGKANLELQAAANESGLTLSTELEPKHASMVEELRDLKGAELDRRYMREMVKDHEKDVAAFQRAAKGEGPVASWAARTLPTLERHLREAREVDSALQSTASQ